MYQKICKKQNASKTCYYCGKELDFYISINIGTRNSGVFQVNEVPTVSVKEVVFIDQNKVEVDVVCTECNNTNRYTIDVIG